MVEEEEEEEEEERSDASHHPALWRDPSPSRSVA